MVSTPIVFLDNSYANQHAVPDFRSSTGLFNTLRNDNKLKASGKHLFDASVYQTDSSTSSFHDMVRTLSRVVSDAKPTEFHEMLATLASEGRLMRLYTQNVDGIDTSLPPLETSVPLSSKGPWPRTVQLHGSLEKMVCSKCHTLSPFEADLFNGPSPPPCPDCIATDKVRTDHAGKRSHGIGKLRPRMVLYNEHNPDEEAIGTVVTADLRARPDAVIVVGTSMEIPGVKRIVREMCGVVRGRKDGLAVWINRGPPPIGKEFEDCWDLVVAGDCDKVARQADMRRWNGEGMRVTDSEAEQAKQKESEVQVVVESPKKNKFAAPALMTPAASPMVKPTQKPKIILNFSALGAVAKPSKASTAGATKQKTTKAKPQPASTSQKSTKPSKKVSKPSSTATKIDSTFKVTKPQQAAPKKKNAPEMSFPAKKAPVPMGPIPPQSARSNSTVPSPSHTAMFPNLKAETFEPPATHEIGRLKRMSEEIVSPTGSPPRDMARLLN